MITRRSPLTMCAVAVVAALTASGCVPPDQGGPPTTEPGASPEAPRLHLPSALPEGSVAIVAHSTPTGHISDYVVDADGARPWDDADVADRRLMAQVFGWLSSTGVELRERDEGGIARCTEFEGTDCDDVPLLGGAAHRGFSPDGTRFAVVEDVGDTSVLRVYDTATLEVLIQSPVTRHPGHQPPVWSPDSASLLVLVPVDGASSSFAGSIATIQVTPGAEPVMLQEGDDDSFAGAPVGWSDDGWLSYLWVEHLGLDTTEYTVRSRPAAGSGAERILGTTGYLSFAAALRDGSVIASPQRDASELGEVPHLFGLASATGTPLARPVLATIGGEQAGSTTRIIGIALTGR